MHRVTHSWTQMPYTLERWAAIDGARGADVGGYGGGAVTSAWKGGGLPPHLLWVHQSLRTTHSYHWATAAQQVGWCYQIISLHSTRSLVDVAVWSLCRFCFVEIKTELGFQKSRKLGSLWSIFIIKLSLIYEMTKNFMSAQDTVYQVIIVTLLHIYGWMFPWRSYSD